MGDLGTVPGIPLALPDTGADEIEAVTAVLRSGRLSMGPAIAEFERRVAARCEAPHAIGVSSGTAGLQLCLEALGVGPGDEVITVSFTFVATAAAILHAGGVPVFVDIDANTLNIDPRAIEEAVTPRTRALLVVHVFGRPAPMDAICAIAERHRLPVIEDACEALGATYRGRPVGAFGDAAVFGFYPNKIITTGEGGVIVTRHREVAGYCRRLRNQGRHPDTGKFDMKRPGYNFRLSELHAALGAAQMKRLGEYLDRRQRLAEDYAERLSRDGRLVLPPSSVPETSLSWFVYVVRLSGDFGEHDRERVLGSLRTAGIGCASYFPALHLLDLFRQRLGCREGDLPVTEAVACRTVALPFFNSLSGTQVDRVCDVLTRALDDLG